LKDELFGKWRRTRYRMTEEDAHTRHGNNARKIEGTLEVRGGDPRGLSTGARIMEKLPRRSDDIEAAVETHQRELIESAATLYAVQKVYGDKVREQSKAGYRRLIDAHLLITGVLATGLLRISGKITPITDTSEERNALFASYVIGMKACEGAIEEGRYLQAHALLRQEMETLAQLKAVTADKRNDNGSPNVAVLEKSLARLYGGLSAAAHVSKHHIVRGATEWDVSGENVPGPTSGTRYFPAFVEELARRSFGLHLALTLRLIEEMSIDLHQQHGDDGFTERELEALNLAVQLMMTEGVLKPG
jgi:hypothetical protein